MINGHNLDNVSPTPIQSIDATLFYFTGTGNSLWAARAVAKDLGSNTEIISMVNWKPKKQVINSPVIGLIFPVHIWGVPRRVLEFLDEIKEISPKYIFAIATNGGQVSNTLVQLKEVMAAKGLLLDSGWSLVMPSNYIPWGGPGSTEKQNKLFQAAGLKISAIVAKVAHRLPTGVEKGPLWQRVLFSAIYKMTYSQVPRMDASFWADERCDQCSLCVKVCPSQNLIIKDSHLTWQHECDQCLACLQWCPKEALQYGKKTPKYKRYHHPEIKMKDMMR